MICNTKDDAWWRNFLASSEWMFLKRLKEAFHSLTSLLFHISHWRHSDHVSLKRYSTITLVIFSVNNAISNMAEKTVILQYNEHENLSRTGSTFWGLNVDRTGSFHILLSFMIKRTPGYIGVLFPVWFDPHAVEHREAIICRCGFLVFSVCSSIKVTPTRLSGNAHVR